MKRLNPIFASVFGKLPLRTVLIVPFVLQIVGTVGLVGYLSHKNGQQAVEDLAEQLMEEVGDRIEQHLDRYLEAPPRVNQSILDTVELGVLDLNDFETLGKYFWQQFQLHKFGYINFGNEKSEFIGVGYLANQIEIAETRAPNLDKLYSYTPDARGNRAYLHKVYDNENPNNAAWYTDAVAAGKPIWSPIYQWADFPDILAISSSYPVYDRDGELIGVLGIDLILSQIDDFLATLNFSRSSEVFIIEPSGYLVASSSQSPPYEIVEGQGKRLKATQSREPLIQTTARYLQEKWSSLKGIKTAQQFTFKSDKQRHFVRVIPFQDQYGLDWLIVVTIPDSDFMAQIHANNRTTFLLCLAASVGSIFIGILTARWVTKPLLHLNAIAKDIAWGEWEKTAEINRSDEVGQLAQSFNQMAVQLQQSFAELQASNQALAESDRKLNQILEAIPVGISVHDIRGKIIYANPTSRQLLGIEDLPEAETEQLAEAYRTYQAGTEQLYPVEKMPVVRSLHGERASAEDMEIRLPGRTIPLAIYSTPLFDEAGKVVAAIAAFFEITEYKRAKQILANYNRTLETKVSERTAELTRINEQLSHEIASRQQVEEELRKSKHFIEQIANNSPQLLYIFDPIAGSNLYINQQSIEILGYTPEEMQQRGAQFFLDVLHPDDFPLLDRNLNHWETAADGEILTTESRFRHKDGSWRWLLSREVVFARDEHDRVIKVLGTSQDISDRKAAELALEQHQEILQTIFDNVPVMLCFYNANVEVQLVNQAFERTLGWSFAEIRDIDLIAQCYPDPDYRACVVEFMMRADGTWRDFQTRTRAGKVLETSWANVRLPDGSTVGIGQDISDRKQAEVALKRAKDAAETASLAKSQFLANMSHELRTPLNAILGFAQVIADSPNLPPEYVEHLGIIIRSGEHLLSLINDVLNMAKIEAKCTTFNPANFDLYSLLGDVEGIFRQKAQAKGLQLQVDCARDVPRYVQTDEVKLRQVLLNLLSNAIKFTSEGNVTLTVNKKEEIGNSEAKIRTTTKQLITLSFAVTDTGAGIAPEELDSIFEAFTQTQIGKQSQGTGLGLSISRSFVQLMGGKLTVSSEVNKGSTFSFELAVSLVRATAVPTQPPIRQIIKQSTQPDGIQAESVSLNRETLAVLPTDWLAKFHQATTEGDFEWMLALIEQIRDRHEPIARALASLTNQLQFEQLLALTEIENQI